MSADKLLVITLNQATGGAIKVAITHIAAMYPAGENATKIMTSGGTIHVEHPIAYIANKIGETGQAIKREDAARLADHREWVERLQKEQTDAIVKAIKASVKSSAPSMKVDKTAPPK